MADKLDNNRHFYLYAKHHYQETEMFEDLKTIMAHYCGGKKEHMRNQDIMGKLGELAYVHLNESIFRVFIDNVSSDPLFPNDPVLPTQEVVCKQLLYILRFRTVGEIPFELGQPDPNVLPIPSGE